MRISVYKGKEPRQFRSPSLFLVDDHPLYLQGLLHIFRSTSEFTVVGTANGGREAIRLARQLKPDIILCDINLPDLNGLEVVRSIKRGLPRSEIIILSMYEEEELLHQAMGVGAIAYYSKSVSHEQLLQILRAVASGTYQRSERISINRPSGDYSPHLVRRQPVMVKESRSYLTEREREVLACIGQGKSNKEISLLLQIEDQTVKNHISAILRKLQARDRTQAVVTAVRQGLIKPSEGWPRVEYL